VPQSGWAWAVIDRPYSEILALSIDALLIAPRVINNIDRVGTFELRKGIAALEFALNGPPGKMTPTQIVWSCPNALQIPSDIAH